MRFSPLKEASHALVGWETEALQNAILLVIFHRHWLDLRVSCSAKSKGQSSSFRFILLLRIIRDGFPQLLDQRLLLLFDDLAAPSAKPSRNNTSDWPPVTEGEAKQLGCIYTVILLYSHLGSRFLQDLQAYGIGYDELLQHIDVEPPPQAEPAAEPAVEPPVKPPKKTFSAAPPKRPKKIRLQNWLQNPCRSCARIRFYLHNRSARPRSAFDLHFFLLLL